MPSSGNVFVSSLRAMTTFSPRAMREPKATGRYPKIEPSQRRHCQSCLSYAEDLKYEPITYPIQKVINAVSIAIPPSYIYNIAWEGSVVNVYIVKKVSTSNLLLSAVRYPQSFLEHLLCFCRSRFAL